MNQQKLVHMIIHRNFELFFRFSFCVFVQKNRKSDLFSESVVIFNACKGLDWFGTYSLETNRYIGVSQKTSFFFESVSAEKIESLSYALLSLFRLANTLVGLNH